MEKTGTMRKTQPEDTRQLSGQMDLPFAMLVLLIMGIGLIMMFSASYASSLYDYGNSLHLFLRQALFAGAGIAIMFVISFMNYQYFRMFSLPLLVITIIFLILVLFIGIEVNGSKRWIDLGITNFQPSEIAKLAVILCFSNMISVYKEKMKTFRYGIMPFIGILGLIGGLMYFEPHLSGIILIFVVGGCLMFVGGVHWGWFAGVISVAAPLGWFVMNNMDYARRRIEIWRDPFLDPSDKGYQIIQSLYAIGSGGFLGLGLGKSRQKYLYLPEEHNDFVFAIVCEELGYIGALIVLVLFAMLILRGYWIALHARDRFGSLMVTGIMTLLAVQTFLNVAVVTNLIPVTGVSLPFFSYGGSSLIIQMAEMGIVLSVSRQMPAPKSG